MRSFLRLSMAALIAGFVVSSTQAQEVPIDKIPAAIMKTVKEKFPKAKIIKADKEVDGKTVFELEMTEDGKSVDVNFTPEGKILVIEREIDAAKLPKAVSAAVTKKHPQGKITKVEEVTENDVVSYEVFVTDGGKDFELAIDADGKIKS